MFAAYLLSFGAGFLSLSIEILWIRFFGFANHSFPQAFAFVLVAFLLGIAIGAAIGKRFCNSTWNLWLVSGVVLVLSSTADLFGPLVYVYLAETNQILVAGFLIALTALLKAVVFPIAHHLGSPTEGTNLGRKISRVYVANIMGSTLGPIFTGIVLLSVFTTQQAFVICAGLTFCLAMYCLLRCVKPIKLAISTLAALLIFGLAMQVNGHWLIANVAATGDLRRIIENPYGIITIYHGGKSGDLVAGGNVYDGRTNLDPIINSNGINRLLVLTALHDKPERVLMIGLSIGTWLKLVTTFPGIKQIDVVEINPAYLQAMQDYPQQESALKDSRVRVYIDDGRRWLKAHPNNQYDMVIINTTYHWRAYSSNLLSQAFLKLIKQHMRQDAVLAFNTTESPDALKTAESVFDHAYLYEYFVFAADFDWRTKLHDESAIKRLTGLTLDGKLVFPPGSESVAAKYLQEPIISLDQVQPFYSALGRKIEVITDENLITEYKYGLSLSSKLLRNIFHIPDKVEDKN